MARIEEDRENLMKEAVAFKRRAEWSLDEGTFQTLLFAGFKKNGSFAIYLNQDPVYQFNQAGKLRRAFVDGYIYRTEGFTLSRLKRNRSDNQSNLIRNDLNQTEQNDFISDMKYVLNTVKSNFEKNHLKLISEITDGVSMQKSVLESINQILSQDFPIAEST